MGEAEREYLRIEVVMLSANDYMQGKEHILPRLFEPEFLDERLHRDILPRFVQRQRLPILWLKIKRNDILRFVHLLLDDKLPPPPPPTMLIQLLLPPKTKPRKMPIRRSPRVVQLTLEDVRANNRSDSTKKILSHDGVLRGLNTERGVFVGETFDGGEEGSEVVNVRGVCVDCTSEGFCLVAPLESSSVC